jgi:hypothetical protein
MSELISLYKECGKEYVTIGDPYGNKSDYIGPVLNTHFETIYLFDSDNCVS